MNKNGGSYCPWCKKFNTDIRRIPEVMDGKKFIHCEEYCVECHYVIMEWYEYERE